MATERNEHLVVVMLKPVPKVEEFEIWEPHITVVPWFPVDNSEKLDETLSAVARRHRKFIVKAGKVEDWGRKEKYPVQKIIDPGEFYKLHWDIFHSLETNSFPIHQKDFMAEKYRPHIALRNRLQRGSNLNRGTELEIKNFTLVKQLRLKKSGRMIKTLVKDYELR